ncbi:putative Coiled-coil domain-containing protein 75 [Glarea lozoyensis 74030]|uniref:Putative Coiled-coil domain-containing protein 75 n=1 Tax=Glarea lozoyensis (strain ATCC 74030 / MF5533) TaxID=1104152 RepID=H0EDW7_GLAL7|nr:putative Coiled-coil domain-containing protein 75 [Glarea lozoyensis 74030]
MPAQDPVAADEEIREEEDYMSMIVAEPTIPKVKETYTQRLRRKALESEARGRTKSKAERALEEAAAREDALAKSLLEDENASKSKGLKMMAKMGFKGGALGKKGEDGQGLMDGRLEPVGVVIKEDRGGIGLDNEKKRKIREEFESESKRVKAEEGDYRDRVRRERELAKLEGQVAAAQRVAERLDGEREEEAAGITGDGVPNGSISSKKINTQPLKSINVLWRGLIRGREEKERDRRMSLSRLPTYDDPDEDKDYRQALGKEHTQHVLVEDLEEEDPELDAFNELEPAERLEQLISHLRRDFNYCFWCKFSYPDRF